MAEGQSASGAGAPADAQDQRSTSSDDSSGSSASTSQSQSQTSDTINNPEAKKYADEAAAERKARRAAEAELKKFQDAQLTDAQKREREFTDAQTRITEYELKFQQQGLRLAAFEQAGTLGIADIKAAIALVQSEHGHELKYGDDGTPENLGDLLKQVIKEHPILAGQAQRTPPAPSAGATNPGRQAGNAGLTRELIEQMTPQQLKARMPEVLAWKKQYDQQP